MRGRAATRQRPPRASQEADDLQSVARRRALERLGRRDHSETEIRRGLVRDGFPPALVDRTIADLKGRRQIDDAGLAGRFARSRLAHRGVGRARIRADLARKGVSRAIIEQGLNEALADASEADALDAVARRYWRQRSRDEPERRIRKLWGFLLRRGFPASLVHARLIALWPELGAGLQPVEE